MLKGRLTVMTRTYETQFSHCQSWDVWVSRCKNPDSRIGDWEMENGELYNIHEVELVREFAISQRNNNNYNTHTIFSCLHMFTCRCPRRLWMLHLYVSAWCLIFLTKQRKGRPLLSCCFLFCELNYRIKKKTSHFTKGQQRVLNRFPISNSF